MKLTIEEVNELREAIMTVRLTAVPTAVADEKKFLKAIRLLDEFRENLGQVKVKVS